MTIEEARVILGEIAVSKSDHDIQRDIDTAQFFSDIFFEVLRKKIKS
jgi:hypothetical protein